MTSPIEGTILAHHVECAKCGARAIVLDGTNVHDALNCECCGPDHTHGTGPNGETEGETCRSVIIHANAIVAPAVGGVR